MKITDVPLVSNVFESGANDRVFDWLLLIGPPVIAFIAVLGRSTATQLLAVTYLVVFVAYVLYRGVA